ncbi:putative mitochondrial carrier protein [Wickerhamomyces ciferrii]|uniref:Putative mitochondrial carrier protein PET8 n=1 Tax=Wickerhamomyces ciferrii (strain ATCC 14091 / BCRC 22168 / CBS 111 / JCM 3599 / NBRC 0793 / NRRL Y-1031 F-60-10) TaxID=1206466 RepID=K0KE82_WICCF|nr:putative mitochondrial carrier protein [Wickerhamomyces ciferrii]CCH43415.1 putative mitochondrial carrier protein [Wickerhamomyces ciferrii]
MSTSNDFFISLLSGAAAGTSTDLTFFPIDTVKTRLQAKGGFFQNGGYKGIYRGLGSAVIASAPSASLFFVTYDTMKLKLKPIISGFLPGRENLSTTITHMISASLGEITACLVRVPAEVIKQRTQTSISNSSLDTFKILLKNENKEGLIKGFYRGWSTTILREIPFTIIQFPLYEWLKKTWAQKQKTQTVNPIQGAICGSIAGGVAAALTTPLDVLKTRIMLNESRVSVFYLAKLIFKEEGFKVFWKGIGPRTMWISAGGAIFLGVYETVNTLLTSVKKNK